MHGGVSVRVSVCLSKNSRARLWDGSHESHANPEAPVLRVAGVSHCISVSSAVKRGPPPLTWVETSLEQWPWLPTCRLLAQNQNLLPDSV